MSLATAQGCSLPADFKQRTIDEQTRNSDGPSIMWQDYMARRPMEVETFLGSPIKLAQSASIKLPRIETLYAIMHNLNIVNQSRPKEVSAIAPTPSSPNSHSPMPPRMSSGPPPRIVPNGMPNGNGMARGQRPRASSNFTGPPPGMRRPPQMNGGPPPGHRPSTNGAPNGFPAARQPSRRGSIDEHDLGEFSHLVLYDDPVDAAENSYPADTSEIALRERELQIRQRELALKEQEMRMRRGPPAPRRRAPPTQNGGGGGYYDDDDEEDDYFDPNSAPAPPMINPDSFDMMSVTSRKNRSKPPPRQSDIRSNPEGPGGGMPPRSNRWRPGFGRNRSSQLMASAVSGLHENILDDPLMGYSSNRYGDVDRGQLHQGSRANSLTATHLHEFQPGPGMSGPYPRRASQSPGHQYSPSIRANGGRPSPPNGVNGVGGPGPNGRPSPPDGMRQPVPRYPPGHGNSVAPQQVEQRVGVSSLQPPKSKTVRSLTGSASASAGSGDSSHLDSEPSAHSSQTSLGPRPPIGVR